MENEHEFQQQSPSPQQNAPVQRPRWQVWGARIGLAVLIVFLILYYVTIARGGSL